VSGEIFNFGLSNANISKTDLCILIKQQLPDFVFFESKINKDPDQRNYIVSNAKVESIGMKAEISLENGITELIKGLKMFDQHEFGNI
jgi:nucleoside-diphosphate-sugar epimerase